jgi:chlorite dismutase
MTEKPPIKLERGLHAMHLFYNVDRARWGQLASGEAGRSLSSLEGLCAANASGAHPALKSYATVGGKADLGFLILAEDLGKLAQIHRDLEAAFPAGTLARVFSYLSVTELTEYMPNEEENKKTLEQEKLAPGSEEYEKRAAELKARLEHYERFRLYPELPDWEVMGFYPMSKRRVGADNWYMLDFAARKKLMGGHARVGRKYGGRVLQMITGSTGLDDWEWGVTLLSHQVDVLKDIVYEMRFDEVSARYGDFGPFYINLRLRPAALWEHLRLS